MRAVVDPNVIISGLLSPNGAPARVLVAADQGEFELITSPLLLAELERALAYPKLRARIGSDDAAAVVTWLRRSTTVTPDPDASPRMRSTDPADDYLLPLAAAQRAGLVSGDKHLLALADEAPIFAPADFLALLDAEPR